MKILSVVAGSVLILSSVLSISVRADQTSAEQTQRGYFLNGDEAKARGGVGNYVPRDGYKNMSVTTADSMSTSQAATTAAQPAATDNTAAIAHGERQNSVANMESDENGLIVKLKNEILFDVGSATVRPEAHSDVVQLGKMLSKEPNRQIRVEGYADSTGPLAFNKSLSQRRAETVRQILLEQGASASQVIAVGYGISHPAMTNKTATGRAQNRRVEVKPRKG